MAGAGGAKGAGPQGRARGPRTPGTLSHGLRSIGGAVGSVAQWMSSAIMALVPPPMRPLFRFFLPLAVTYTVMMLTHLVINAGLARTATPAASIAAYSIGFSIVTFFEAPALVMRPASISMARGAQEFRVLSGVAYVSLAGVTAVMATIAFTPLGTMLLRRVFNVPEPLWELVLVAFRIGLFVPLFSGLRQLFQGVIVYRRETGILTVGIFLRLFLMWLVITGLLRAGWVTGAALGMVTFVSGLGCEMLVALWWLRRRWRAWQRRDRAVARSRRALERGPYPGSAEIPDSTPGGSGLQVAEVVRFVVPFFMATLVEALQRPGINAVLGRVPSPELGLAAFAVAWTMAQLVINWVKNLHQVMMVFGDEQEVLARRFVLGGGLFGALLILAMAATPLGRWVVVGVLGVDPELATAVRAALWFFAVQGVLMGVEQGYTGRLLLEKRTALVTLGRALNLSVVLAATAGLLAHWPHLGATAGACALAAGTGTETLYQVVRHRWEQRAQSRPGTSAGLNAPPRRAPGETGEY